MKKIFVLFILGLLAFSEAGTLETIQAQALLDAENKMSADELEKKYSEAIEYFSSIDEYIFAFPKIVGKCSLDVKEAKIYGSPNLNIENKIAEVLKAYFEDDGFVIAIHLEKGISPGTEVFFEYQWKKDGEEFLTNILLPLELAAQSQEILNIPGECATWEKYKITKQD